MAGEKKHKHGGDIYEISKDYGVNQESILDFSANINPLGVPQAVIEIIEGGIKNIVNYPDPKCMALRDAISNYLEVGAENLIVGNGASEIIFLLFEVLKPRTVLMPAPTFAEYEQAAVKYGAGIRFFELSEEQGFKLQVEKMISEIDEEVDCVILCNPNNPTSTLISREELLKLVKKTREMGVYIILDEAFIELTVGGNQNSMIEYLKDYENLYIIRAFTKLFAIPGLRLGYGIGSGEIIKRMWDEKLPWTVNSFACNAGRLLTDTKEYLQKTGEWLEEEKKWLYNEISKFSCLKVFEPQTNFILVKLQNTALCADILKDRMVRNGILIRNAGNFRFLDKKFFRVAVKDRESNKKLIEALNDVLKDFGEA